MTHTGRSFSRGLIMLISITFCFPLVSSFQGGLPDPAVTYATSAARARQANPSVVGSWGALINWLIVPVHISLMPNGKVLFWTRDKDADGRNTVGNSKAYVWDPASGSQTPVPNGTTNVFCAGHSFLPDGRLLVTGGHSNPDHDGLGERHVNIFDFKTNAWSRGQDMNNGRWYPYNVMLSNAETLVVSGSYWDGTFNGTRPNSIQNKVPQVLNGQGAWRDLTTATNPVDVPNYPWLHLMADGRVFVSGPQRQSYYLDTNGTGSWTPLSTATSYFHDIGGSSVMYAPNKVMNVGGYSRFQGATNAAEVIDLNSPSPQWRTVAAMNFKRVNHTATLLPDGKVLVTGGSQCPGGNNLDCPEGAVKQAEIWDPVTEQWSVMASHQEVRLYHSIAMLLPDARVLVGGGGLPAAIGEDTQGEQGHLFGHKNVEVFTPPYLYKPDGTLRARPQITRAPTSVNYWQNFFVETAQASTVTKVSLVRLPSVTHTFNQDQRVVFLNFTQATGGLTVAAPTDGKVCPPGHYMLFLINSLGVPSRAAIIQLPGVDTVGLFRQSNATFYLRNTNTTGVADTTAQFGDPSNVAFAGDWDGDGSATIGIYNPNQHAYHLRNSNTAGPADILFQYGNLGDKPIFGDWNKDGTFTIGVYRPSTKTFYLRNSNSTGVADVTYTQDWSQPADAIPIAGDWDGNGLTSTGLYFPGTSTFYLRNQINAGPFWRAIQVGAAGDLPVVGDWDGDGTTNVGVYRQGSATFYLRSRNDNSAPIWAFAYGTPQDRPVAGNWRGGR